MLVAYNKALPRSFLTCCHRAYVNSENSMQINTCPISSCFTRGFQYRGVERRILTCFPDTDLTIAKELMEAKGIKQLPVVARCRETRNDGKRRLVGLLYYDAIERCLRLVAFQLLMLACYMPDFLYQTKNCFITLVI